MELKTVDLDELTLHPDNPHQHPEAQIDALGESLDEYEQVKNVVVWQGLVLAGNGLVMAARKKGLKSIAVQDVSEWDEAKAKSYMAADIRLPEMATTDLGLMGDLLKSFDEPLEIPGFDDGYLAEVDEVSQLTSGLVNSLQNGLPNDRKLGDRKKQIKPVLYADEVGIFEMAIKLTGLKNRAQALMKICEAYIGSKEGQYDFQLENVIEEAGVEIPA